MNSVTLPVPMQKYFEAKGKNAGVAVECFTADAVFFDHGEDLELRGADEIRTWLARTSDQYKLTSEVGAAEERDGLHVVTMVVTGDFPGSPYEFAYRFLLEDNKIKELAIDPIGSLA